MKPLFAMKLSFILIIIACVLGIYALTSVSEQTTPQAIAEHEGAVENSPARFVYDPAPIDRSSTSGRVSYADVLENATPSVVSVYTARVVKVVRSYYNPQEELFRRFFGLPSQRRTPREGEVEEKRYPAGMGSGVIISENGYILTNNHVITNQRGQRADEVLVRLSDGTELDARIIGTDPKTDVALLKIESEDLPSLPMANSDQLRVGDIVFAIGNPLGVGQTVTQGIVSATGRSELGILGENAYENFIQTDASINSGNSGGALIDATGRLVGINSAIISPTGGNIGIGFAVPVNIARRVMEDLIDDGRVQRGLLGVSMTDLDSDMAEAFGLDSTDGALVQTVEEGLPAARVGILRGDVIVAFNGKPVASVSELRLAIGQTKPGVEVSVTLVRNGSERKIEVVLADLDDPFGTGTGAASEILTGITVTVLDDELREKHSIDRRVTGLVITDVARNSPYARGFRAGMVIAEINDREVHSIEDARPLFWRGVNKLWVYDRGTFGYLAVRLR